MLMVLENSFESNGGVHRGQSHLTAVRLSVIIMMSGKGTVGLL
jgi:hypothetical protein